MTDLTEKWKAGELDRGKEYWCKVEGEGVLICYLTFSTNKFTSLSGFQIKCLSDDAILEVLARCDYEELQELKGLLKEVKEFIEEENPKDYTIMSERMDELLTKIEETLK